MHRVLLFAIVICLLFTACSAARTQTPAAQPPRATLTGPTPALDISSPAPPSPGTAAGSSASESFAGLRLPVERGELFNGSGTCAVCHTNMKDEAGVDVSNDTLWRSTLLANAARDPYWQATVRSEVEQAPQLQAEIQEKCATCHMPMAKITAVQQGSAPLVLDDGFLAAQHPLQSLALDGVSCTVCHQQEPDNFGRPESFSGAFQIDLSQPAGERRAYGPYPVDSQQASIMKSASGFVPVESEHTGQAEMCAACHNLYTPFLDEQGQIAGLFPEQMIYSEWVNSAYRETHSCQQCHMPLAKGGVQISITGGPKRSPFYQHVFVGGNAFMGRIFQMNAQALQTTASTEQFEATINSAIHQIETQTADLALENVSLQDGRLSAGIVVQSKVGHKLPAGFPSRRAWLHITILDRDGQAVFESGAFRPDGMILGNENDEAESTFEPHYNLISTPDQVQIYEAILQDSAGKVTTTLLRAAQYAKDNRLLPAGFDLENANADIAIYGQATQDADFQAGGDRVALGVDLSQAQGPFTLQVELLYQSIGFRWAESIRIQSTTEAQAFAGYYASVPNLPLVAARVETQVEP